MYVPSPDNNRVIKIKHDEADCSCRRQDRLETHIQGVSGGIVNILGGSSMDYSE